MRKIIVYIAGPITGIKDNNEAAFAEASMTIKDRGCIALNPLEFIEHNDRQDDTWEGFMKRDISYLIKSDIVVCLEGSGESRGAQLEMFLAEELGIPVMKYSDFINNNDLEIEKKRDQPKRSLDSIMLAVSLLTGVSEVMIKGSIRRTEIKNARFYFCYIARKVYGHSYVSIGRFLSNRDHTTIISAVNRVDEWLEVEDDAVSAIDGIKNILHV